MYIDKIELFTENRVYNDTIAFYLIKKLGDNRLIAENVEFTKEINPVSRIDNCSFELDNEDAQILMDNLWNCGLRPTQGRQSEGLASAQSANLKDLRTVLFNELGIKE